LPKKNQFVGISNWVLNVDAFVGSGNGTPIINFKENWWGNENGLDLFRIVGKGSSNVEIFPWCLDFFCTHFPINCSVPCKAHSTCNFKTGNCDCNAGYLRMFNGDCKQVVKTVHSGFPQWVILVVVASAGVFLAITMICVAILWASKRNIQRKNPIKEEPKGPPQKISYYQTLIQ